MNKYAGIIAASLLASTFTPVLAEEIIVARAKRSGDIIVAADLVAPSSTDALRRASTFIGRQATRNLRPGEALAPEDLQAPRLILRNAVIQMEFANGPMLISAEGKALDAGGLGDRIRVMNMTSKRIVSAIVIDENTVRAQL